MRTLVIGSLALAVSASGITYASTASPRQVHACAARTNGALRLAAHCTAKERSVTWGAVGPQGLPGAPGPAGAPGQPSALRVVIETAAASTSGSLGANHADCPVGYTAVGGGFHETSGNHDLQLTDSYPIPNAYNGQDWWWVGTTSSNPNPVSFTVYAICAQK